MKSFEEDYREVLQLFRQYLKQEQEQGRKEIMSEAEPPTISAPSSLSSPLGGEGRVRGKTQDKLQQMREKCSSCRKCSLARTRNNLVFGQGSPSARVVFIGEAPGGEEDRQGVPFVGRAGELFNKMLAAINLKREEIYITNILKCRPPSNRDPLPQEISLCYPWLTEQLKIIRPKIICTLGRIAAQTLLNTTTSLSNLRGRIHQRGEIELIATYHPAALLRNVAYKRPAWEDLKLLKKEYKKLKSEIRNPKSEI